MLRPYSVESVTNGGRYLGRSSTRLRQQVWYYLVVGKTKTTTKKYCKTKTKLKLKNKSKRKSHWWWLGQAVTLWHRRLTLCDTSLHRAVTSTESSATDIQCCIQYCLAATDLPARLQPALSHNWPPWSAVQARRHGGIGEPPPLLRAMSPDENSALYCNV